MAIPKIKYKERTLGILLEDDIIVDYNGMILPGKGEAQDENR